MRTRTALSIAGLCVTLLLPTLGRAQARSAFVPGTGDASAEAAPRGGSFSPLVLALVSTAGPILAGAAIGPYNGNVAGLLISGGMLIGPSVGQFYSGSTGHGWAGIGIRGVGGVMTVTGMVMAIDGAFCGTDEGDCSDRHGDLPVLLALGGGLTYLGGVLYSFIDTPFRLPRESGSEGTYGFAPALMPDSQGGWAKGVSAWLRF